MNERLTEWMDNGEEKYAVPRMELKNNGHQKCCNKLAEYEDLEEQGLLLRLPCHCKECKHVDYAGCAGTTCYCMKNGAFMQEDDFCKYAEKKRSREKLRGLENGRL